MRRSSLPTIRALGYLLRKLQPLDFVLRLEAIVALRPCDSVPSTADEDEDELGIISSYCHPVRKSRLGRIVLPNAENWAETYDHGNVAHQVERKWNFKP